MPYHLSREGNEMKLSIGEAAKLLGVSLRTLRYYDEIGLVRPSETSEAGYRFYDGEALARLQQILFYRELEFPLRDIAEMLSRPDSGRRQALLQRKALLLLERQRIDGLIALADASIEGEIDMTQQRNLEKELSARRAEYAKEAAARWGKTDEYQESLKRQAARSSQEDAAMQQEADEIFAAFAAAMDKGPASPEAQALVKRWLEHVNRCYYPCTKQILACLGQMYVSDERFTRTLDRFGDGNTKFIAEAIAIYCR